VSSSPVDILGKAFHHTVLVLKACHPFLVKASSFPPSLGASACPQRAYLARACGPCVHVVALGLTLNCEVRGQTLDCEERAPASAHVAKGQAWSQTLGRGPVVVLACDVERNLASHQEAWAHV
jgi:hypothetical protein